MWKFILWLYSKYLDDVHFVVSLIIFGDLDSPLWRTIFIFLVFFFLLEKSETIEGSEWGCYWGTDSRGKGIQKTHEYLCRSTQHMASHGHHSTTMMSLQKLLRHSLHFPGNSSGLSVNLNWIFVWSHLTSFSPSSHTWPSTCH